MMEGQRQSSQNMMQMMMTMMTTLVPVLAGNKTDPIAIVQAMAALNSDKPTSAPMTEMIQTMVAMKELIGDGGSGGDDSFLGGAAKALLPMLAKGAEGMVNRQPSPLNTMVQTHPDPIRSLQPSPPLPMPMMHPNPTAPAMPPSMAAMFEGRDATETSEPKNRIVALIKEDVLYFAKRGHDPAMSAGAILDVIDSADVPDNEILELVVSFQSSQDWIADLAAEGVDLTSKREWAQQLLEELVKQYAETQDEDDHPQG